MMKTLISGVMLIGLVGCASVQQEPVQVTQGSATPVSMVEPVEMMHDNMAKMPHVMIKGKMLTMMQVEQLKKLQSMDKSVYFDFDQYTIKSEYFPVLEEHAKFIKETNADVLIQGNTDQKGSREYNLGLGQKRSESVKESLSVIGVRESNLEATSLGEEKPTGSTDDKDRRADFVYHIE